MLESPFASQTPILYLTSLEIVWISGVAIIATRALFRDFAVPVPTDRWMFRISLNIHSNTQIIYEIAMNVHKGKSEKLIGVLEGPQKKSRPVGKEVTWNFNKDRDKNGRTYWTTASHRLILSPQMNREPSNTEEKNRIENLKAPSAFQASPGTVRALFGNFGVPVSIEQCRIKNDSKISTESGKNQRLRPTETTVSCGHIFSRKNKWETYLKGLEKQTPNDLERSFYWDTGWRDDNVIKETLANDRTNKENLPVESGIIISGREIIVTIVGQFWDIKDPTPTTGSELTPNSQLNVKPGDTEGGNWTKSPNTPSVPQASLGTVLVLSYRDTEVPVSPEQNVYRINHIMYIFNENVYRINQNVFKFDSGKAIWAVESLQEKPETVKTSVSSGREKDYEEKRNDRRRERETVRICSCHVVAD
jgi:hypothetical protein